MVWFYIFHGVAGHGRANSVFRVLDDGGSALLLDGSQAHTAVIERAGENNSDDAFPVPAGGAAKKRVDGGAVPVFSGPADHANKAPMHQQVMIGRGHVDDARPNGLAIFGMQCAQLAAAGKDIGQIAGALGGNMQHKKDRRGKISRQSLYDFTERFDSAT